jgi:SAM-dependent methyltransferase
MSFTPKFPFFPTIDIFIIRNQILKHVRRSLEYIHGNVIDIGCGDMPYRKLIESVDGVSYVGVDLDNSEIERAIKPDIYWDGYNLPIESATADCVYLTEVLEHCPDPKTVLSEASRVIKKDGLVIFSVPFIWYLHEAPYDFYRYTPYTIKKMFDDNGFDMEILETYGSNDMAFLHTYFIWLKKSRLPKIVRFSLYLLTLPFILLFYFFANKPNRNTFDNGDIFIGIVGIARKR